GMVVGNAEMINALFQVKSNLDSGAPQAIQQAAIEALRGSQDHIAERNAIFQRRRDKLMKVLDEIGLEARIPKATFYIWARVPQGYSSVDFTRKLLDESGIAVTPGTGYGKEGLRAGWGFPALIKNEKIPSILFDTSADDPTLLHNMRELDIDPKNRRKVTTVKKEAVQICENIFSTGEIEGIEQSLAL
ncbi:unnamed protein product, partial [marine sediment metagenome]